MRRPEGQGLNDLYVRFFRMAERRIAEKTGQSVVCFISNYSWLDGLVRHEALCNLVGCKDPPSTCRSRSMKLGAA